jgi:flagellar basal-body rod protein FlgG
MAIEGDGFFQIIQPNGETAYSRGGSFKIDSDGRVVTSDGFALEPELTVPTDTVALSIGTDGTVSVLLSGENEATEIGNIELAQFTNPAGLNSIGRSLFIPQPHHRETPPPEHRVKTATAPLLRGTWKCPM